MHSEGSFLQRFHTGYPGSPGAVEQVQAARLGERLNDLLDTALNSLEGGNSRQAFRLMGAPLSALRNAAHALDAGDDFRSAARRHPIFAIVQQDPCTRRAFEKPRGHAGDAVMLDFIHDGVPPLGTTLIGKQCFFGTTRGPIGLSIVHRCAVIRAHIDHAVAGADDFRVLALASGHCRELEGSLFLETPCQGEFVALDPDPEACERLRNVYKDFPVRVQRGGVEALLDNAQTPGAFDLIYTAGLLDTLTAPEASRLVHRLCELLRPDGTLLLSSFVPASAGRGYMEAMMDWQLTHRDGAQLQSLFPPRCQEGVRTHLDPHGNVAYAELRRSRED